MATAKMLPDHNPKCPECGSDQVQSIDAESCGCQSCGAVFNHPSPVLPAANVPSSLEAVSKNIQQLAPRQEAVERLTVEKPGFVLHSSSYAGASELVLSDAERQALAEMEDADDDQVEIRPEGQPYVEHTHYRRALNKIFGPGEWALVPTTDPQAEADGNRIVVFQGWRLIVRGKFVGAAVGSGSFWKNNAAQDKSDALEAAQSNALARIVSKSLGIYGNPWLKSFRNKWIREYAVQVFVRRGNETKKMWRRRDAEPFEGETGEVNPMVASHAEPTPRMTPRAETQKETMKQSPAPPIKTDQQASQRRTATAPVTAPAPKPEPTMPKTPSARMVNDANYAAFIAQMRRGKKVVGEDATKATAWLAEICDVQVPEFPGKPEVLKGLFMKLTYDEFQQKVVKSAFEMLKRQNEGQ